jgi:hypothetical protein
MSSLSAVTNLTAPAPVAFVYADNLPPRPGLFQSLLVFLIVAGLPFTYAGTLDLGFPLKLYEVMSAVLFATCALNFAIRRRFVARLFPAEKKIFGVAVAYFVVAVVSSFLAYFTLDAYRAQVEIQSWSQDPALASALKCGYLFLDLFILFFLLGTKGITVDSICNWWFVGGVAAALYGWYLFLASFHGATPPVLPGQTILQREGPLFPVAIRGGTFREGNHVATYYLLSGILAGAMFFRTRRIRYALLSLFFLGSIIHTLSTSGSIAALAFFIVAMILIGISSRSALVLILPLFVVMTTAGLGIAATPFFQEVVMDKLTGDNGQGNSLRQRQDLIYSGFDMFKEHPFLGIGLSNFGYLYPYYTSYTPEDLLELTKGEKQITNNVYSEVSTETGLVGIAVFLLFCGGMLGLYRASARRFEHRVLFAGLIGLFVAWMAYPTFSILFQWVFFAVVIRSFVESRAESETP